MGKNWDKPYSYDEFKLAWMGHPVNDENFQEYHELHLNWGDIHVLIGEPRGCHQAHEEAYPKYIEFCKIATSPLGKALA
jgi:hypothetical protein